MTNNLYRRSSDKLWLLIFCSLVGAACLSVIGIGLNVLIKSIPDNTQYYYFAETPVKVNKKVYEPCDAVIGNVKRVSKVTTDGIFFRDLILVKETDHGTEITDVYQAQTISAIAEGTENRNLVLTLPCEGLQDGTYYWRGLVAFKVNSAEKNYHYETEKFQIINRSDSSNRSIIVEN